MNKRFLPFLLFLCLSSDFIWSQESRPLDKATSPISLQEVLQAAQKNFAVNIGKQDTLATQADILSANHSPLPVFSAKSASAEQLSLNSGQLVSQRRADKSLGIDWAWERGDKKLLRTKVAQNLAAASQADLTSVLVQQQISAKDVFFEMLAAQEKLEHVKAMSQSADQLAETAKKRQIAGDLSAQDLSRVEIESERVRIELQNAMLELKKASISLYQITGIALRTGPIYEWQVMSDWPQVNKNQYAIQMQDWLLNHPEVRSATQRLKAAQTQLENAQALKKSDPTIGLSMDTGQTSSNRLVELRVQIPLQINYSYEGELARATAQAYQAQDILDKVISEATSEFHQLQQDFISLQERLQSYQIKIVPRAQVVAKQAELAYSKGAIPLVDLLDARRTLRASLLDALNIQTGYAKSIGSWQIRQSIQNKTPFFKP